MVPHFFNVRHYWSGGGYDSADTTFTLHQILGGGQGPVCVCFLSFFTVHELAKYVN